MTTKAENQRALQEISDLLPDGYVKYIPFSVKSAGTFEFNGVSVKMSALYLNEYLNCYMFDLAWGATDKIYGIPIRCGVDILHQYSTPLPNLYAFNTSVAGNEVTSWRALSLFIIDESVLERG